MMTWSPPTCVFLWRCTRGRGEGDEQEWRGGTLWVWLSCCACKQPYMAKKGREKKHDRCVRRQGSGGRGVAEVHRDGAPVRGGHPLAPQGKPEPWQLCNVLLRDEPHHVHPAMGSPPRRRVPGLPQLAAPRDDALKLRGQHPAGPGRRSRGGPEGPVVGRGAAAGTAAPQDIEDQRGGHHPPRRRAEEIIRVAEEPPAPQVWHPEEEGNAAGAASQGEEHAGRRVRPRS